MYGILDAGIIAITLGHVFVSASMVIYVFAFHYHIAGSHQLALGVGVIFKGRGTGQRKGTIAQGDAVHCSRATEGRNGDRAGSRKQYVVCIYWCRYLFAGGYGQRGILHHVQLHHVHSVARAVGCGLICVAVDDRRGVIRKVEVTFLGMHRFAVAYEAIVQVVHAAVVAIRGVATQNDVVRPYTVAVGDHLSRYAVSRFQVDDEVQVAFDYYVGHSQYTFYVGGHSGTGPAVDAEHDRLFVSTCRRPDAYKSASFLVINDGGFDVVMRTYPAVIVQVVAYDAVATDVDYQSACGGVQGLGGADTQYLAVYVDELVSQDITVFVKVYCKRGAVQYEYALSIVKLGNFDGFFARAVGRQQIVSVSRESILVPRAVYVIRIVAVQTYPSVAAVEFAAVHTVVAGMFDMQLYHIDHGLGNVVGIVRPGHGKGVRGIFLAVKDYHQTIAYGVAHALVRIVKGHVADSGYGELDTRILIHVLVLVVSLQKDIVECKVGGDQFGVRRILTHLFFEHGFGGLFAAHYGVRIDGVRCRQTITETGVTARVYVVLRYDRLRSVGLEQVAAVYVYGGRSVYRVYDVFPCHAVRPVEGMQFSYAVYVYGRSVISQGGSDGKGDILVASHQIISFVVGVPSVYVDVRGILAFLLLYFKVHQYAGLDDLATSVAQYRFVFDELFRVVLRLSVVSVFDVDVKVYPEVIYVDHVDGL